MDIMLWIIVCTLACIGISAMIGDTLFARRSRRPRRGSYRIVTLYDDPAEVERVLNQCLLRMDWQGPDGAILLVDMGMGEEALAVCTRLRQELYGSFLCHDSEVGETLRSLDRIMDQLAREGKEL